MDIFDAYEMADDAVADGIWADLVLMGDKIGRIKVRPTDPDLNADYRVGLAALGLGLRAMRKEKGGEASEKQQVALTAGLYADTIVTDFELWTIAKTGNKKGQEVRIPYSAKKTKDLLIKLPKLMSAVSMAARQWTNFRKHVEDETVKA